MNETNTVNQLQQLFYNIHLLIPRFMKSLCVITIQLNTLTDIPYQMTVGGAFVYMYVNICERGRVKEVKLKVNCLAVAQYTRLTHNNLIQCPR